MDRILGDNGQQASYVSINHKANPSPYALQFKNFEDRLKHGKTKSKQTTLNMRKQKESPEEDYLKIAWGVIKDKMQVQFFE